jgi:hypothetical protein
MFRSGRRWSVIACLLAALIAPVQAQNSSPPVASSKNLAPGFTGLSTRDTLLLMPIDVELYSLSAGGIAEPRADWTAHALQHMNEAIRTRQQQARVKVLAISPEQADDFAEQVSLHAAVAQSISLHHFGGPMWELPTKAGQLNWSFGNAMQPLRDKWGADYALFIWVRDTYASQERVAAMAAVAILSLGHVVLSGGVQVGYASLVDLRTGDVVWFNRLQRGYGDLRQAGPARESIEALMGGYPSAK